MPAPRASTPLDDLVVLDLTRARAGPTAARQFADWGANVIKIEQPGDSGEEMGRRHGADFQNLHRNKRGMTLNLKSAEGHAIFLRMAAKADVVVENLRPDVKHRLKVDYETLRAVNRRIVYGSISGFGQDGPYAHRAGVDQIAQGMGGHMSVTGEPGRGPMRSGAAISDMFAGILCANAMLTALHERSRTGEGQWVQTSLLEAQIFLMDFQAARWTVSGEVAGQEGNHHPTLQPMGAFRARDGYINIAPVASMWKAFCDTLDAPHILTNPDFDSPRKRHANRAALIAEIEAITSTKDVAHWNAAFDRARIPCGPVYTLDQTFADPQVRHLGVARDVDWPAIGKARLIGQPIHMSRARSEIVAHTPDPGEHTDEVLVEFGYTAEEIAGFRARGVV